MQLTPSRLTDWVHDVQKSHEGFEPQPGHLYSSPIAVIQSCQAPIFFYVFSYIYEPKINQQGNELVDFILSTCSVPPDPLVGCLMSCVG